MPDPGAEPATAPLHSDMVGGQLKTASDMNGAANPGDVIAAENGGVRGKDSVGENVVSLAPNGAASEHSTGAEALSVAENGRQDGAEALPDSRKR